MASTDPEWARTDDERDAWSVRAGNGPPYPYYRAHYKPWSGTMQKEVEYMGLRIVAQDYVGAFDKSDTMGFTVPVSYVVLDDFDERALPFVQSMFWSPWDARNAIWFNNWFKTAPQIRKWKETPNWALNEMLDYRRKPHLVYAAIHDIRRILREASEFDENPTRAIQDRLYAMDVELRAWTPDPKDATT